MWTPPPFIFPNNVTNSTYQKLDFCSYLYKNTHQYVAISSSQKYMGEGGNSINGQMKYNIRYRLTHAITGFGLFLGQMHNTSLDLLCF